MAQRVIGELIIKIKGQDDGVSSTIDRAKKKSESMTSSFIKANLSVAGLKKGFNLLKSGIESIINTSAKFEQYQVSFETMLGSAQKATGFLKELQKFAAATPFSLDDLAAAGQQLLAFGIDVNKIMPSVKMLGDISQGNSDKFRSLTLAFAQIQSTGRLMGQDLLQLINAGFNPLTIISEKTGKTMAQLKKDMERGAISSEMVADAFKSATSEGGRFFNAMQKQSKTYSGLVSTMGDSFSMLAKSIGDKILPIAKDVVQEITKVVDKITEFFDSDEGFTILSNTIAGIAATFRLLFDIGKELVETVFNAIKKAMQPVIDAFKKLFPEGAKATVVFQIITGVLKVLSIVLNVVANLFSIVIQSTIDTILILEKAANTIRRFFEAMADPTNGAKWKVLTGAAEEFGLAVKNMVVHTVEGIDKLTKDAIAGAKDLINNTTKDAKTLEDNFVATFTAITNKLRNERNKLNETLDSPDGPTGQPIGTVPANAYRDAWIKAFTETKNAFLATLSVVQEQMSLYEGFHNQIAGNIQSIVSQASSNATSAAENEYNKKKKYIKDNVKDEVKKAAQLEALEEEYAATQLQLKKDSFNATKAFSIVEAVINTARSVVNALATPGVPFPVAAAFAIAAGISGAVQVGLIASQQPPAFASGGYVQAQQGGIQATIGEGGVGEYVVPDSSNVWNSIADRIASRMQPVNNYSNVTNNNMPGQLVLRVGENDLGAALTDMSARGKFHVSPRGIGKR